MSEEWRYPTDIDVVVSACTYRSSILSQSGRLFYVREEKNGVVSSYLLNFETNEKRPLVLPNGSNYFLTDNLVFHSLYGDDEYVLDIDSGNIHLLQRFRYYVNGNLDTEKLVDELQKASSVFLINNDNILSLGVGFPNQFDSNFVIDRGDLPGRESDRLDNFLEDHNIVFTKIVQDFVPRYPNEVISPEGRFIAQGDGIHIVETGQQIAGKGSPWIRGWGSVRGWTPNGSAVIYSYFLKPCVFQAPGFDGTVCVLKVPQPVLKINMPEEYLLPASLP